MSIKFLKTSALTLLLAVILPGECVADIVVITNPQMPVTSLSRDEIYRIYLGKTKFLSNGVKVIAVDQKVGSPSRQRFYAEIIQKSETEMQSYWSRLIFTGQGNPPIQEIDDRSVKDLVAKNPSCMGYIDKSFADGTVKIVFTLA